jgi:threonine dehydrogenase-like Zn-dependent dehydrogenase
MVLETNAPEPLYAEDVEVAAEYCGMCHSDLSVLNMEEHMPVPNGNKLQADRFGSHLSELGVVLPTPSTLRGLTWNLRTLGIYFS